MSKRLPMAEEPTGRPGLSKTLSLILDALDSGLMMESAEDMWHEAARKHQAEQAEKRTCGNCRACCYVLDIRPDPEGESLAPAYEPCPHLNPKRGPKGCSVHDYKPEPCKTYLCLWRHGWGRTKDRPDRMGMVFESHPKNALICVANEVKPGARYDKRVSTALFALRRQYDFVIVTLYGGEKEELVMPPKGFLESLDDAIERDEAIEQYDADGGEE